MSYLQSNENDMSQDAMEMDYLYDDEVGQPYDFGERISPDESTMDTYMEDDTAMEETIILEADLHTTFTSN